MADEKKVPGKTRAGGVAKPFPWEEAIAEQYERTKSRLKGLATEPEAELQRILEQYLPKKGDSREERLQKLEDLAMGFAGSTTGKVGNVRVKSTVKDPLRMAFPGIYQRPDVIAAEAASRVAPESPNLKAIFGVTRDDLYEMGKGRKGNLPGDLPGAAAKPRGSEAAARVMTPKNERRLIDTMAEAEKHPELVKGMDPWYVMDPLFQRMEQLLGRERAIEEYTKFNTLMGMASPGSEVLTEIPRGTAAYHLQKQGRFPDFFEFAGVPAKKRGATFPADILNVPGHMYHRTSQALPMQRYLETGELAMDSPKVPMYIEASGVPQTGFQTATPVGDAHWSRAVGLADTRGKAMRKGEEIVPGASVTNPEMTMLAPWWREEIAGKMGLESVPAQARAWGTFSGQTGVTTPIGAPKLELIADKIAETARRLGISLDKARDLVLTGEAYAGKKAGGAIKKAEGGLAPYGIRHSGEGVKGRGYFGLMAGSEGTVTELSAEDDSGEFPLVVPTLTAEELDRLLAGKEPTPEMLEKASSWAATRRKRGESPFASPTELRMPRPKAEGGSVYSPRPGLVFVGQEHGAPADVPQDVRDLANQVGAFYEGSGGDKLPDIRYRGSWDDAASRSVKGYPPEYLYTIFTNTDVNKQKDALVGDGTIFNSLLKNQQRVGYFKDRRFNRKDLTNFLQSMGPEFLKESQNPATEDNVDNFLKRGEALMWESGDTPARQMADKANESRQRWLLNQPKGVFFMGSDHLQKLKELHEAGKKTPVKRADGGAITDLPDEVTPANWREHLQTNVLNDARALLGVKDGGVINLDELIEKALKKKDGGVINLDELIEWTLAKAEHRKMKEGGAVKMQGGGNPGEVSGEMFKPKPLTIPEPITDLVEALRRQFEKEKRSMRKPGAAQDVLLRGPVAAYAGAPADILGMGGELLDYAQKKIPALRKPASVMDTGPEKTPPMGYAPVFPLSPEGSYGTTAVQEMMGKAGLTTGEERPLFETGAMFGAPVAGYAGLKAGKALAPTAKEMLETQFQRAMSPYQMYIIKPEGGNWVRGAAENYLKGLKYLDEVDPLGVMNPADKAAEQAIVNSMNNFVDKKMTRYFQNQLGTPSDPVRIQADEWAGKQKTLLADKQKQIDKVRSDIEKARRERNVDPEVLTRSQARLRELQKERDLIKNRKGLHFDPGGIDSVAFEAASRRRLFGAPNERAAQSEFGKRWEDISDVSIYQQSYMQQPQIDIAKTYAELKNAAEGTNIVDKAMLDSVNRELEKMGGQFALDNPEALAYRTSGLADYLGFNHLMDELDNALRPSQGLPEYLQLTPKTLDKMSMQQAVEHVDKINAWRASQVAEVDKARAANAATVLHKEYPEQGLRWVEIKAPDTATIELPEGVTRQQMSQTQGGLDVPGIGYVSAKYDAKTGDLNWAKAEEDAKKILATKPVEDALKYEGEILQHCVGGYCPDVIEGRSRIFSLRDADGRPYATIEVEPEARIGFRQGEGPKNANEDYQLRQEMAEGIDSGNISENTTFAEWWRSKNNIPEPVRGERISQIKGPKNQKPEAEFIPYIQDFVKGGTWSRIGDIENTELMSSVKAPWRQRFEEVGIEVPDLFSQKDYDDMVRQYFEKTSGPVDLQFMHDTYGFPLKAKGGSVHKRKSITTADLEREYRMAYGGGVFNTDPDKTDAGRIIPEHTI